MDLKEQIDQGSDPFDFDTDQEMTPYVLFILNYKYIYKIRIRNLVLRRVKKNVKKPLFN